MRSVIAFAQNKVPVATGEAIRLPVESTASTNLITSILIHPIILNFILDI